MNSPLDTLTKRFTPCVIICPCDKWLSQQNPEAEEFKRGELPGRYTVKLLYGWDDKKFDEEYLKKLQKNWNR